MKQKTTRHQSALLEIGVEELPARFIPPALEDIKKLANEKLAQSQLSFESIKTFGTPRRLTLIIDGLPAKTIDRTEFVIGPPPKAAKNESGEWTQAALGFAKSQSVSVSSLVLEPTPKGDRYVVKKLVKGQKTANALAIIFPEIIKEITFPKSMVWETSRFRFARPIRWMVALFNTKVIRFSLAGIKSDHCTYGLMSMGNQKITITNPSMYLSLLQNRCIVVDPNERKKKIENQLDVIAKKHKAIVVSTEDHLMEVVNITEYPVGIAGKFSESFLKLPPEVLISVLRKHQKFFPLESEKKLTNLFIGVRNGASDSQDTVRDGYEKVVAARLSDAQFFFEQDKKLEFDKLYNRLSEIGFHEKLGTIKQKCDRVERLVGLIGRQIGLEERIITMAERAAHISKVDLLTSMVGEFPELQGTAGRFYAEGREPKEVAQAIEQHHWPLSAMGTLPQSDVSCLVAICDKSDTLAANFSVGLMPSGSADPYGLRRAALGILRILLKTKWDLSLDQLITVAQKELPNQQTHSNTTQLLKEFMIQRFSAFFENQGYRSDEIDAVLSSSWASPFDAELKLLGLMQIRSHNEFSSLAGALKRARNILTQAQEKGLMPPSAQIDPNTISGEHERHLLNAALKIKPELALFLKNRDYNSALLSLAALKTPIDDFFEKVMVMADDSNLRSQRLSVLLEVKTLFDSVIDFSRLQSPTRQNINSQIQAPHAVGN